MRVDLKVTKTPDLKSKQPWPQLAWQGSQVNNVLLMDMASHRLKVLCLTDSGKGDSKKKVARLQSRLQQISVATISACGNFLVCLLYTGDILLWHKDTDKLHTIRGIPDMVTHSPQAGTSTLKPQLYLSRDACKLLIVIGSSRLFLWERDQSGGPSHGKQAAGELRGGWSHVGVCGSHTMPTAECKETAVHAQFFTDVVLGECCICSFVFNHREHVHITSVMLRWTDQRFMYSVNQPRFTAQWDSLQYPLPGLAPGSRSIRHHGAYVIQHSHQGATLAVAANQRSPYSNRMMFLSVTASGAVVVDLKGCGCTVKKPNPEYARSYWISELSWTWDDLFVVCITKRGSVAILSRLGEPLVIQSEGCSVEHGPQYFLPFHPLITIVPNTSSKSSVTTTQQDNQPSPTSSLKSEADEKRQRFCIATHPTKPLILCSDGYLATIMELPENLTCTSLMTDFLSEGRTALNLLSERQHLGLSRLEMLKFEKTLHPYQTPNSTLRQSSSILAASSSREGLVSTGDSDVGYAEPYTNLDDGKIVFGFPEELEATQRGTLTIGGDGSIQMLITRIQRALFSTWGLGLSHIGTWTPKLDNLLVLTANSIVRLCEVMLHSSSSLGTTRGTMTRQQYKEQELQRISKVFQDAMTNFLWDMNYRNSQTTALTMTHQMVRAILRYSKKLPSWLAPKCCVAILQFSERLLANVYTMVPKQQPSFHINELQFHQGDIKEAAMFSSVGKKASLEPIYTSVYGSVKGEYSGEAGSNKKVSIRCLLGKRLIRSWKMLHDHLVKQYTKLEHHSDSTIQSRGVSRNSLKRQRLLLVLLCEVQRKLHHLGWNIPLSFSQLWADEIHKTFLKGCEWYINGYVREAIRCWQLTTHQAQGCKQTGNTSLSTSSSENLLGNNHREQRHQLLGTPLETASLVAVLYTHLERYDLSSALKLVDQLIHCYQGSSKVRGHRTKKGTPTKLVRTSLSFMETIRKSGKVHFTAVLPCIPLSEHRSVVACLARWMALYFTNQTVYIYPACSAILLPSLIPAANEGIPGEPHGIQPRMLPLYHDHISSAVRHQDLSEVWTVDTALALLLVCGLIPEAVWLARELGDWKSAFTLSVLYTQQYGWLTESLSSCSEKEISLPEQLGPDSIMIEGLNSLLQTKTDSPTRGKHERRASMDCSGDSTTLLHVRSGGMKKSSSMCSIHDEDKASQEQLARSLTDMLTAATLVGLDPTLWLLCNMTDDCISFVSEFNTLVPDDFYLPAPPYYCPQPEYIPKDGETEEVLHEVEVRRKVNDHIQVILLVLNSSYCSLPCAKWYVQQLSELLHREGKKKKTTPQMPKALAAHSKYQLDILEDVILGNHLPPSLSKLLQCFRNLCTVVWLLHARDKLSMSVRKYQAWRERSLRVKTEDPSEAIQHKTLLHSIIEWASCLHPFITFLQMEDEVQDILLTAISELPANKHTVILLARHFHSGRDGLYPAVEEKFARLMEKLKMKREVVDKRLRRQQEAGDTGKGKKSVRYETLHKYFKRQCQRRKLEISNRQADYGSFEEQIFVPEDSQVPSTAMAKDSQKELASKSGMTVEIDTSPNAKRAQIPEEDTEDTPVSPRQAAHSHPKQKKMLRQQSFSQEVNLHPCIGSREFETSALFLDFLETFFLVAFGKIAQNLSPASKPDVPLLGAFTKQVKKDELNPVVQKILGRQKSRIELDISSTLNIPFQVNSKGLDFEDSVFEDDRRIEREDGDDVVNRIVHNRGLFYVLGKTSDSNNNVLNESIRTFSRCGYIVPSTPTLGYKQKDADDWEFTGSYLHSEPAKPYANIRLNLGKKYQKHVDLLQWLVRWTERQQRLHHGVVVADQQDSKAVLRVKLPQQLILNSLWLLENCYYPELFREDVFLPDDAVNIMTAGEDTTTSPSASQRVHFDTDDRCEMTGDDVDGEKKWKDSKLIQARMKSSSSSGDETEERVIEEKDRFAKVKKMLIKKKVKKRRDSMKELASQEKVTEQDVKHLKKRSSIKEKKQKDRHNHDAFVSKDDVQSRSSQHQEKQRNTHDENHQGESGSNHHHKNRRGKEKMKSGDASDKEKTKKKRRLPLVTSEHLSTAVDYKTEAQKARARLYKPEHSSSLRSSPTETSLRSVDTIVGMDEPDAGARHPSNERRHRKSKKREGVGSKGDRHHSDSSSLNVSSLDEDNVAILHKDKGSGIKNAVESAPPHLSMQSSSGDVRKMVRQEFKKMMEKSILNVLNSSGSPPGTQRTKQNDANVNSTGGRVASNKVQHSRLDSASRLLHPHTESAHGVHQGNQEQMMIQTWHGEEPTLHKSLRGVKPMHRSQSQKDRGTVAKTKDSCSGSTDLKTLHKSQGNLGDQSAILMGSSEMIVPFLTLADLDSGPGTDMPANKVQPGRLSPVNGYELTTNRNNNQNNNANQTQDTAPSNSTYQNTAPSSTNQNTAPSNSVNQNTAPSNPTNQIAPSSNLANQNGVWDQDEYDTIPTRDSDEFVPSNSSSSHNGGNHGIHHDQTEIPGDENNLRNVPEQPDRNPPPPGYHSTFAFAEPQIPPLLRLNDNGRGPQDFGPPLAPMHRAQDESMGNPRQGWSQYKTASVQSQQVFGHPHTTQPIGNTPRVVWPSHGPVNQHPYSNTQHSQTQPPDYNINNFLPAIPLLTLDSRGPSYRPSQAQEHYPTPHGPIYQSAHANDQVPMQQAYQPHHMPLLTLDPTPSYHRPTPVQHVHFQSNIPYSQSEQTGLPIPTEPMAAPRPMTLLHLDGPPQPYLFKSNRGGVGTVQLIPPDDIIAFEQKRYKEKAERQRQQRELLVAQEDKELVEDAINGSPSEKLLHLKTEQEEELVANTRRQRRTKHKDSSKRSFKSNQQLPSSKTTRRTKTTNQQMDSSSAISTDEGEEGEEGGEKVDVTRKTNDTAVRKRTRSQPIVMLVDKDEEEEEEDAGQHDGSQDRQSRAPPMAVVVHEPDNADQGLGSGYAIQPGSYDAMLSDHDTNGRTVLPTSAEIHLNVVRKLQEKAKTNVRDASSMTRQNRDVSTSMDTNGLSRDIDSRFGGPQDPVSQYTTAATGVNDTGHIVAPDIFFSLRFANKPTDHQASVSTTQAETTKGTSSKPSDNGHDYISVVDIDSEAISDLLHQPDQSSTRPKQTGTDHTTHDGVMEQQDKDRDVVQSDPTVAELHYNALFHKDAHPQGLSPLSTQQMAGDDHRNGPDPVTERVLQTRPQTSVKAVRTRSQSARDQSKQRVYQRLAEMAQQLDAIDEVSKNMDDDFKNTKLMLNTVEHLSETVASGVGRSRPELDIIDATPKVHDRKARSNQTVIPASEKCPQFEEPEETAQGTEDKDVGEIEDKELRVTINDDLQEDVGDMADKELHVTINDDVQENEIPEKGPMNDTMNDDVLGITGLSGVSDIIAEALADEDAETLGISEETKRRMQAKRDKKRLQVGQDTLDYTNMSSDQLRDIFSPRSTPRPGDEDEDEIAKFGKKPKERTEEQQRELKEWMSKKQAKSHTEYKKKRDELIEREPRPYHPPINTQLGATQKVIKQAEQKRESHRRTTDDEHYQERAKAARQLMAEIFAETLDLPPEPKPHPKPTNHKASKLGQTVTKPLAVAKGKPSQERGTAKGQSSVPKGTYLFIDSGVYPQKNAPVQSTNQRIENQQGDSIYRRGRQGRQEDSQDRHVPPIQLDYSSDEDYYDRLDAISEIIDNKENEPVQERKPKSYKDIVRMRRPEVTRKKRLSPRKPKTYGEMLKELKQETNQPGSSISMRSKQRLYGTKRVPGANKGHERKATRVVKPYTQRLSEMKQNTSTQSRLVARSKPRRSQFGTATVTLNPVDRRQQVEGRGLRAEKTPRTSTPYTERLAELSNTETFRRRDDVVSAAPKVGIRYQPKTKAANNYVDRLHDTSAGATKTRHKVAYVGALGATYKSPNLHTPSPRHRPYRVPSNQDGRDAWDDDDDDDVSGMSDLSPWSVSDDVKRILQEGHSRESLARGYTTDEDFAGLDSLVDQDDYLASVDIRELEEIASIGSESVGNIDWAAVEKMIEDVQ